MKFEICSLANAAVITWPEKLSVTSENAYEFRQLLKEILAERNYRIIIDAANLEFIDSSGISAIISGLKTAMIHDGFIHLVHVPDSILQVFELIRLDKIISIYESLEKIPATDIGERAT